MGFTCPKGKGKFLGVANIGLNGILECILKTVMAPEKNEDLPIDAVADRQMGKATRLQ